MMAGERCDLNRDEAEILKPSSSASPAQPSPFLNPPTLEELPAPEKPEATPRSTSCMPEVGEESPSMPKARSIDRCSICRKRVRLSGFRCRCGELFCGRHRYSDTHDCSFDYKAAGREQIARANPLIRAAKIIKI